MFGRERAGEFLLSPLNASTVTRYRARAALFDEGCHVHHCNWWDLPKKVKTLLWQIFALTFMMEASRDVMVALQKLWPRKLVPSLPEKVAMSAGCPACSLACCIWLKRSMIQITFVPQVRSDGRVCTRFAFIVDHDHSRWASDKSCKLQRLWLQIRRTILLLAANIWPPGQKSAAAFSILWLTFPTGSKESVEVSK